MHFLSFFFCHFSFWQRWQNIFPTAPEINMLSSPVLGKLANCHSCSSIRAIAPSPPPPWPPSFSDLLAAEANFLVIFSICVASHWYEGKTVVGVGILGCFMAPVDNCNKNVARDYNKRIMSCHAPHFSQFSSIFPTPAPLSRSVQHRVSPAFPFHSRSVSAFLSRFAMSCAKCQLCLRAKVFDFSFSVCGGLESLPLTRSSSYLPRSRHFSISLSLFWTLSSVDAWDLWNHFCWLGPSTKSILRMPNERGWVSD